MDAAVVSLVGHASSMLALAFRMSMVNVEIMRVMRAAPDPKKAGYNFLASPYYRSWSRAQLNNTEYAPMLSLLCLYLKYRADQIEKRELRVSEKLAMLGSVFFSYVFIYAAATQGRLERGNLAPGQGGMSPLRPIGALGRYACMLLLIFETCR